MHPTVVIKNAVEESLQGDWLVKLTDSSRVRVPVGQLSRNLSCGNCVMDLMCWQDACHMLVIVMTENMGVEELNRSHQAKDFVKTKFYINAYGKARNSPQATVLLAGDPRPFHEAKHTMWVQQRKELEKLKTEGFDEVSIFLMGSLVGTCLGFLDFNDP